MPSTTCLFCRTPLTQNEPPEHIIPQALLSNPSIDTILRNVCSKCNNTFGGTIDADFLNSSHIKYLTYKHAEYLTDNKFKKKHSIRDEFKLIAPNGDELKLYRIIDKNGVRIEPKPGPQYLLGKPVKLSFLETNSVKDNPQSNFININIENPEEFNTLKATVNFPRFICKVALEYIYFCYGDIAYSSQYDNMRQYARGKINALPDWQRVRDTGVNIDPLNAHYRFSKHDEHTLALCLQNNQWNFVLSVFNVTSFYLILPPEEIFREQFHTVKINKDNRN